MYLNITEYIANEDFNEELNKLLKLDLIFLFMKSLIFFHKKIPEKIITIILW